MSVSDAPVRVRADLRRLDDASANSASAVDIRFDRRSPTGDRTNPKVTVVIPALNEAANLPYVLPRVPKWVHEILVVDGNSTDGTEDLLRDQWPEVFLVAQEKRGKGDALRAGFKAATGDIVVMLDADGSTDPAEIPLFVGALLAGADFAKGSRFIQGGGTADISVTRNAGNKGLKALVRLLFGYRYSDLCYGYNAFWKRVVPALELDSDGFEIETLMNLRALRMGLRVAEVPSFEYARIHGESRLVAIPDGFRVLKVIVRERFRRRRAVAVRHRAPRLTAKPAIWAPALDAPSANLVTADAATGGTVRDVRFVEVVAELPVVDITRSNLSGFPPMIFKDRDIEPFSGEPEREVPGHETA